jgi:hypothetical protein
MSELFNKEEQERLAKAMQACASEDPAVRAAAQRAFAATLGIPLRKAIFDEDTTQGIFERDVLAPGATPNYPLDFVKPGDEDQFVAFTLPKTGRLPERHVEGDELWVPTFRVGNAIDWDIRYMRMARFDVVARAMEVYRAGYVRKNNSDAWRTILAAANDRGMIVVASGAAPFTGNTSAVSPAAAGEFTKELIARARTAMVRGAGGNGNAGKLTDVYLSMEAMEDVRAWSSAEVDDFTRREIIQATDQNLASVYGVALHPMTEFGEGQEYQNYLTTTLSASLPSNTREWCVGLDLSTLDSFVNPVVQELETFEDPNLYRSQKMGVFGWLEHGYAVLDARRALLMAF